MRSFLQSVFTDLRARRNLDVYVVATLALILAMLSVIPDAVSNEAQNGIILASLGLLVINLRADRRHDGSLDEFLGTRAELRIPFRDRLKGVEQLYIYAASAANVLNADHMDVLHDEILDKKSGVLHVILQNPHEDAAVKILVRQLDQSTERMVQSLTDEIPNTIRRLRHVKDWKTRGKFAYKLLDYSPGFSLVAVDPHRNSGYIIVEFYGFHNESTDKRMSITIYKRESDYWFSYWWRQFEAMWADPHAVDGDSVTL